MNVIKKIIGVFIFMAAASGNAQAENLSQTTYGDWLLVCNENENKCLGRQVISVKQGQGLKNLLVLSVVKPADNSLNLEVKLPFGLDLRRGIVVRIDQGKELNVPFLTCLQDGCSAVIPLSKDLSETLGRGKTLAIGYLPLGADKVVAIEASLNGWAEVIGRVKSGR